MRNKWLQFNPWATKYIVDMLNCIDNIDITNNIYAYKLEYYTLVTFTMSPNEIIVSQKYSMMSHDQGIFCDMKAK